METRVVHNRLMGQSQPVLRSIALISAAFWTLWACLRALRFECFLSVVRDYGRDSVHWQQPFDPFHVPGCIWPGEMS